MSKSKWNLHSLGWNVKKREASHYPHSTDVKKKTLLFVKQKFQGTCGNSEKAANISGSSLPCSKSSRFVYPARKKAVSAKVVSTCRAWWLATILLVGPLPSSDTPKESTEYLPKWKWFMVEKRHIASYPFWHFSSRLDRLKQLSPQNDSERNVPYW